MDCLINFCNKMLCLKDCHKLDPRDKAKRCMIFRVVYERKKMSTQDKRYKDALEESEKKEQDKLTVDEIEAKAILLLRARAAPETP